MQGSIKNLGQRSNLLVFDQLSDVIDMVELAANTFYQKLMPECLKKYTMPIPNYHDNVYDTQYLPYTTTQLIKQLGHVIVNDAKKIVDASKYVSNVLYYGYYPFKTMEKLKLIHTIPKLMDLIHEIIGYGRLFVCDRTLNIILNQLSNIDPTTYTVKASLNYYRDYRPRGKFSEIDTTYTLCIELVNNTTTINIEEPCYSWLYKTFTTRDNNGNLMIYTVINGNTFK